ncbi:enoyl-CoA hydratase/isomerase family protein [Alkalicoccobacillus porphyridii]|uniref:3-hydroxyisobutyryl-CoA hydrolase n=1 Tax=Alkalicoccobacillus porphyridii TaxID=2597270 RepID=A0A554A0S9_9BACI|nr:enoyl-CoA hydratase/isomerase family protein [Alkalicoccobacillus porphyridii]TSB47301.1 enoyl-CoA hydratase/isomerase family protein [Alkalicoccobacillus porphyridii]
MKDINVEVTDTGVGIITLTREKALNSLSSEMIQGIDDTLRRWETDQAVRIILVEGSGAKAFCAGGDIKELYQNGSSLEGRKKSTAFLNREYDMDSYLSTYPKPIVALMDGIVMGGGVGLSYGANYRIVTENTKWAMPETAISFFPDIGAGYFLNQAPDNTGLYLGLTGKVIRAEDVLYINAADYYMTSDSLSKLRDALLRANWLMESNVDRLLKKHIQDASETPIKSELESLAPEIKKHFLHQSFPEIVESLQSNSTEWAKGLINLFSERSPVSLLVTFAHLKQSKKLSSFSEALERDKQVAAKFMECEDFYEGVRCLLVDRGSKPAFIFQSLNEVPAEYVSSFLKD